MEAIETGKNYYQCLFLLFVLRYWKYVAYRLKEWRFLEPWLARLHPPAMLLHKVE